jgi:nucleotide-binding universal stress UspA family protein
MTAMSSVRLVEEYGPKWVDGPYERGTDGPRVILVGVDGSESSMRAAAYAAGLARRQRSRLMVVYVTSPSAWTGMGVPGTYDVELQTFDEVIKQLRSELRSRADEIGVPVTFTVRGGDSFGELRHAATEANADMVVIGASEQAGHRLVGSVASRLVRAAVWPVVVVP